MKRLIALFLVALMLVMALAACNNTEEPKPTEKPTEAPTEKPTEGNVPETPDFESAKAFLKAQVLKSDTAITAVKSFDVPAQIKIGPLTYTVEWASSLETVTVAASATEGFCTVTIPDTNAEEVTYVLTATIKYGEESVNLEINAVLPVIDNAGITSDLQENVAYKMFLYQVTFKQNLYATHEMDQDKYFKGTNDPKAAPDFFAEKVDGGFKFYTMIDGAKKYVNAYLVYDEAQAKYSKRLNYADSTDNVWTYEADTNAWFVNLPQAEETVKYVLGTYGEYKTFCISEASYITPSNTGVSQFPASFITKEVAESKTPDEEYVPEYEEYTIGNALALEDGVGVIVLGVVSEVNGAWNEQYGNMNVTITDGKDTLYIYRLATKVEKGDAIVVTGKMGSFKGSKQIAEGATAEIVAEKSLAEAVALEDGTAVVVKGTVSEINGAWSEQYGNMNVTISDGTDTLYLYRLSTNVKEGDVVTVVGKVDSYKGSKQLAQGCFAIVEGGEEGGEEGGTTAPVYTGTTFDVTVLPVNPTNNGNDAGSYVDRTSEDGWVATGCRVDKAAGLTGNDNPVLTLNGKTTAPGTLKSPTIANGIAKLSFKYGFAFGDNQISLTINVKKGDEVVATTTLEKTGLEKNVIYDFAWDLETAVEGEFVIEVVNNCKSASTSNKDRLAIWDFAWVNAK